MIEIFKLWVNFTLIGLFNTSIAYLITGLLIHVQLSLILSMTISFTLTVPISFYLNRKYVFKTDGKLIKFLLFFTVQLASQLINYFIINNSIALYSFWFIGLLGYAFSALIVFLSCKLYIFKK